MTTRDTTPLLSRSDAADRPDTAFADRMAVIAFGAVQWPWLLRSLSGGSRAEKQRLLDRLDLAPDALPNLGSWKADTHLLHLIVDCIVDTRPATVVELGCGATSLVIARALAQNGGGTLTSFDQHADFSATTAAWLTAEGLSADMRHAPLGPPPADWPGRWYQLSRVPDRIDLLVIDGPPWTVHPLVRGGAEMLFDRIAPGGTVMLDDAARPGERLVARQWRARWPDFDFAYDGRGTKGTLVGRRRG